MPIIGSQSPWLTGAGIAGDQGNQLAQTLLRVPFLRQQIQQGQLQNQLLQGQVNFQPQQQGAQLGLLNARTGAEVGRAGAEKARSGLYDAQRSLTNEKETTIGSQNTALKDLQAAARDVMAQVAAGQTPSPELQAQFTKSIIGLDPKTMGKVVDSLLQSRGAMNPALMNDPRMQAASMLGNKTAANGVTLGANAVNYPPGGGPVLQGDVRTGPGQQVTSPGGQMLGNNPNHSGSQSSALQNTLYKALTSAEGVKIGTNYVTLSPEDAAALVPKLIQSMQGPQGEQQPVQPQIQQPAGVSAQTNRSFIFTPQGLIPKQ